MAGHGPRGWVKIVRNWSSDLGQDRENRVGQDREKPWVKIVGNDIANASTGFAPSDSMVESSQRAAIWRLILSS